MGLRQTGMYCANCEEDRLFAKSHFSDGIGCFLSLLFCPFVVIWLLIMFGEALTPMRCQTCGSTYSGGRLRTAKSGPSRTRGYRDEEEDEDDDAVWVPTGPTGPSHAGIIFGALRGLIVKLPGAAKALIVQTWNGIVESYRALPEWATPIVWGLGISAPIVTLMFILRQLAK